MGTYIIGGDLLKIHTQKKNASCFHWVPNFAKMQLGHIKTSKNTRSVFGGTLLKHNKNSQGIVKNETKYARIHFIFHITLHHFFSLAMIPIVELSLGCFLEIIDFMTCNNAISCKEPQH